MGTLAAVLWLAADLSADGAAAMRAGRYTEAEKIYRQLVKQSPREAGWQGNLGLALYSQGRFAEAIGPLKTSLQLRPADGLSQVLLSAYLKVRRYAEAAPMLERSGRKREAAQAWWQARDYARALPLYRAIAAQHASDPGFAYEFGDSLARAEGAAAAVPVLERSVALIEGRAALGKAYVELARFADAILHLEAAAGADPDLLLPLSRAYKETGRAAEAERALSEYRKRQTEP
jgi:predicted Zn-dependent protease